MTTLIPFPFFLRITNTNVLFCEKGEKVQTCDVHAYADIYRAVQFTELSKYTF